jgi:transketolase
LALAELGGRNPDVVVLSSDLDESVRVHYFHERFPERFIQAGIAEQNMVSMAAGLANAGKIPFACTFAAIVSTRALDQVNVSVAYSNLNVKIVGAYLGVLSGKTGATHQALADLAIMRGLPGMTVLSPCDAEEVAAAVEAAAEHVGPLYMRIERDPIAALPRHQTSFEIGKGLVQRDGDDVALIGTGAGVAWALSGAELLAGRGIQARVIDLHTIKPLDEELVLAAARQTRGIVTVENHSIVGGLGGAVAELVSEKQPCRILRVGIRDTYGESGDNADLLRKYGLTPEDIAAAAERVLAA